MPLESKGRKKYGVIKIESTEECTNEESNWSKTEAGMMEVKEAKMMEKWRK